MGTLSFFIFVGGLCSVAHLCGCDTLAKVSVQEKQEIPEAKDSPEAKGPAWWDELSLSELFEAYGLSRESQMALEEQFSQHQLSSTEEFLQFFSKTLRDLPEPLEPLIPELVIETGFSVAALDPFGDLKRPSETEPEARFSELSKVIDFAMSALQAIAVPKKNLLDSLSEKLNASAFTVEDISVIVGGLESISEEEKNFLQSDTGDLSGPAEKQDPAYDSALKGDSSGVSDKDLVPEPGIPAFELILSSLTLEVGETLEMGVSEVAGHVTLFVSRTKDCQRSENSWELTRWDEKVSFQPESSGSIYVCAIAEKASLTQGAQNSGLEVQVNWPNFALIWDGPSQVKEREFVTAQVRSDADVPGLEFSCIQCPPGARIDSQTGRFVWTVSDHSSLNGRYSVRVEATSSRGSGELEKVVEVQVSGKTPIVVTTFYEIDESQTSGECSLVEAILAAETNSAVDSCSPGSAVGPDWVLLEEGVYHLTEALFSGYGLPEITSEIMIVGKGRDLTKIQRSSDNLMGLRLDYAPLFAFFLNSGTVTLRGLTLSGGGQQEQSSRMGI